MSSNRIHTLFFAYNRIGVSRILRPLQYVQGSHSTVMLFYSYIHAEQIFTTKSVTIFYIVALCFSAFDVYYN